MTLNGVGELMTAVGLAGLLWGEWRGSARLRIVGKPLASAGFIVAAIGFGAFESRYGGIVFVGLVLGAVGDVCLLGAGRAHFLAGLISFLLGHIAYVVAFTSLGVSPRSTFLSAVAIAVGMAIIANWVFPHAPTMRVPIGVYMLVIAAMCAVAIGASALGAPWMVPVGALMFTVSDIAVVRDRFVSKSFLNRLWGLPLYYAGQLIIAWSIKAVGA